MVIITFECVLVSALVFAKVVLEDTAYYRIKSVGEELLVAQFLVVVNCAVAENIHTSPWKVNENSRVGGGGLLKQKC